MSAASDYLENQLRTHLFRTGSFAKPAALYVSLHTANPTDAGTGTEVTGGNYARVQRNPSDANWSAASATDGLTSNVADLTFPAPTAAWGTVTHFGVWDAATAGNLLCYGALTTARTINSGDSAPVFPAGALALTVA
jgi:hypothetical protein